MKLDVLIRGVDAIAVKQIDEKARQLGTSRSQLGKQMLEKYARDGLLEEDRKAYTNVLTDIKLLLEIQTKKIARVEEAVDRQMILTALLTGMEVQELEQIIQRYTIENEGGILE